MSASVKERRMKKAFTLIELLVVPTENSVCLDISGLMDIVYPQL